MLVYALLALIALPLVEIALFVALGGSFGVLGTLLIVIGTALLGFYLLTQYSLRALLRSPQEWADLLREGDRVLLHVLSSALLAVAGLLLLLPGFFTDTLGVALLLPMMRDWAALALLKRMAQAAVRSGARSAAQRAGARFRPTIIEGEYKETDSQNEPPPSSS